MKTLVTLVAGLLVGASITVALLGGVDDTLRATGLSDEQCAEFQLTGRELCGDELVQFCDRLVRAGARDTYCNDVVRDS